MANAQRVIVPEAERLGYSEIHLYIKYQACRVYFAYRAQGHDAITASEEAVWPSMHSGSVVRAWANDFTCGTRSRSVGVWHPAALLCSCVLLMQLCPAAAPPAAAAPPLPLVCSDAEVAGSRPVVQASLLSQVGLLLFADGARRPHRVAALQRGAREQGALSL